MIHPFASALLRWYAQNGRDLPWRHTTDPYPIWLSEVILQQTRIEQGRDYWHRFMEQYPTVEHLADASEDEVLRLWQGLGYYSRARNLQKAARIITGEYGGQLPADQKALMALPGIGDYTAAAVAAIAFDRPAAVMDGNVERVISRFFAIGEPLPGSKPAMKAKVAEVTPLERPGDFAQGMMDLGATICTPRNPACWLCPWSGACAARAAGAASSSTGTSTRCRPSPESSGRATPSA